MKQYFLYGARLAHGAAVLLGLSVLFSTSLSATELLNDGWSDGQAAAFQDGFVIGEMAASRFVPAGPCPCALNQVSLLFGGNTEMQIVSLHVWEDGAGTDAPGPEIFSWDFELTGADDAIQVLDVEAFGIFVNGPFRVGFEFFHVGFPSIARDDDTNIQPNTNFILFAGLIWFESSLLGHTGDWIIRATVDEQGEIANELKNDAWPPSLAAHFQGGFVAEESAAIRLTPPGPCPCSINGVNVLIGGAPGFADIGLRIWDDSAMTDTPGALIYSDDLSLASAEAAINFIPLVGVNVNGPFRLGFEMLNGGFPAVARDDDGIHPGLNFIDEDMAGWVESETLGLLGDWIMRAAVTNQNLEVANLGFDDWDAFVLPAFQDGFVAGEIAAVRLEPNIPCPCLIRDVRLMFGGAEGPATVTVHIWEDGGVLTPGSLLYSHSHILNPNLLSLRTIDLQTEAIEINGPIRVGIEFDNPGVPSVARDHDGILPGNNFISTDGTAWVDATSESVPGDWIIRARIVPVLVFNTSFE